MWKALFLVSLLCLSIQVGTGSNVCATKSDGCSAPSFVRYKRYFKSACDKHDICYYCAEYKGLNKDYCDSKFYRDMKRLCGNGECREYANTYYNAVRFGGWMFYENSSPSWCNDPCVSRYM